MEPTRMLRGPNIIRIFWVPGTDLLVGECHCRATHFDDDPATLWEWLLNHPVGHRPTITTLAPDPRRGAHADALTQL